MPMEKINCLFRNGTSAGAKAGNVVGAPTKLPIYIRHHAGAKAWERARGAEHTIRSCRKGLAPVDCSHGRGQPLH